MLLPFIQAGIDDPPYEIADLLRSRLREISYLSRVVSRVAQHWQRAADDPMSSTAPDRRPSWDGADVPDEPYPVVFRRNPAAVASIPHPRPVGVAHARTPFAIFETSIEGVPYQTLLYLMYDGSRPEARLSAVAGFMVDMAWVKTKYFSDFINQIHDIVNDPSLSITISDTQGRLVAAAGPLSDAPAPHVRQFPVVFADPALVEGLTHSDEVPPLWTARVGVAGEAALAAANRGTSRTLAVAGLGVLATIVGLGLTGRATHAAAGLAAVQSEFVSAVSHEMKTPLSLIKLASDTLATGRCILRRIPSPTTAG